MSVNPTVWSSRFGFLMASIGFAVGLGNIWRFPYVVGENGGSIFIVIYLCCVFFIGVPILMAEIMLGRRGAASPEQAIKNVAVESSCSPRWSAVGYLNLLTSFLIVFVYSVVAGWVLYYFYQSLMAGFSGTNLLYQLGSFEDLQSDVRTMVFWSFAALAITGSILVFGVQKGIERAVDLATRESRGVFHLLLRIQLDSSAQLLRIQLFSTHLYRGKRFYNNFEAGRLMAC